MTVLKNILLSLCCSAAVLNAVELKQGDWQIKFDTRSTAVSKFLWKN